ncbi:MAG: helix-turn-helix transcriptional regulator [Bacteroidia bacterium]|nr:helix-turn-helix transcriptional regulator [Bacteroidia bacterium]
MFSSAIPHSQNGNHKILLLNCEDERIRNELSELGYGILSCKIDEAILMCQESGKDRLTLIVLGSDCSVGSSPQQIVKLKSDPANWQIPCVFIDTGETSACKVKIWESGADAYFDHLIPKEELLARSKVLINNYLRAISLKEAKSDKSIAASCRKQTEFLDKLARIVKQRLKDEKFSPKDLAKEIGLSHSQLHRRLKAEINQNCGQFIKKQRLLEAKKLIFETKLSCSEVSYSLGFSSPSYFTRCFKEEFGYLPSAYLKR